jgi:ABC-type cobalamin/Fe3+-siderophores transport system ATPase subunit
LSGNLAGEEKTDISGGERQLTLIARALQQDSEILSIDEPAIGLD